MEQILRNIPQTANSQDDVLISGRDAKDHLENLDLVLTRLEEHNIKLNLDKCKFMVPEIEYLGHKISAQGLQPLDDKVQAVLAAPVPQNVTQLRSFLGLLNYYHKFLPDIAAVLHPLYELLQKGQQWEWTASQDDAYQTAKRLLSSSQVLAHFDHALPLLLACDASSYGVGAILSHKYPDGTERPISFASRTLSSAERNYAQVEKEGLAVIYGVQKFHQYLFGRHFTLVTDHKPLTTIFGPKKGIPHMAAARLQRWALFLSAHSYDIIYRTSVELSNADALSRVPLETEEQETEDTIATVFATYWDNTPISKDQIAHETRRDKVLAVVVQRLNDNWLYNADKELEPYFQRRHELSVLHGCILWGMRVVVPTALRERILDELHGPHQGMVRMKTMARSYVWWPQLDRQIEEKVKRCAPCQSVRAAPVQAPLHPWPWPAAPWKRLHADFAGPFAGFMFLIIIDASSKWPEVFQLTNTSAATTIDCFRESFSRFGLPMQVVTDNGPQFRSEEFRHFMKCNGVKHVTTAPYHPASNGQAERFVHTMKQALKKAPNRPVKHTLMDFLLIYRNTPHQTTGESPAKLLTNRVLTTRLDLLRPDVEQAVLSRQWTDVDRHASVRAPTAPTIGARVWTRNYGRGTPWVPATVERQTGPVSFVVSPAPGIGWRRHQDQITPGLSDSHSTHDSGPSDATTPRSPVHLDSMSGPGSGVRRSTRTRFPPRRLDL